MHPQIREVAVTLPDGAVRRYPSGTTPGAIATDISKSLGKAALAARVDGRLADLSLPIDTDVDLAIVTAKDEADGARSSSATTAPTSWPAPCRSSGPT